MLAVGRREGTDSVSLALSCFVALCCTGTLTSATHSPGRPALATSMSQAKKLRLNRAQLAARGHAAGSNGVGTEPRPQSLMPKPTLSNSMLSIPSRPRTGLLNLLQERPLLALLVSSWSRETWCVVLLHGIHDMRTTHCSQVLLLTLTPGRALPKEQAEKSWLSSRPRGDGHSWSLRVLLRQVPVSPPKCNSVKVIQRGLYGGLPN